MEQATQQARNSLPAGVFDTLPQSVKDVMIAAEQRAIDAQTALLEEKKRADDAIEGQKLAEQREIEGQKLAENERLQHELEMERLRKKTLGLTTSLDAIGTSKSMRLIHQSKEYIEGKQNLFLEYQNDVYTHEQYEDELKKLETSLFKIQNKKYYQERKSKGLVKINDAVRMVEDVILKKVRQGYMGDRILPRLLHSDHSFELTDGKVPLRLASKEYIESKVTEMIGTVRQNSKDLRDNHTVTVQLNLFFSAKNRHKSFTKNMVISISDGTFRSDWFEDYKKMALEKLAIFTNPQVYEELEEAELAPIINLHVNVYQFMDIKQWFPDLKKGERYRDFADFRLFLCADGDKPCEQQLVEYYGKVYDQTKSLEEMLAPMETIVYTPLHSTMSNVYSLDDLVKSRSEVVETTDCANIARIIKLNKHVGVITNIFKAGYSKKSIKRARYTVKEDENEIVNEVFLDFETFRNHKDRAEPYLICYANLADEDTIHAIHSEHIVKDFVTAMMNENRGKTLVLYAWNGSGFDHQLLVGEIMNRAPKDELTMIRANRILHARFEWDDGTKIILRDPMLFIPSSLHKAAKDFNCLNKGDFPHNIVKGKGDLDRVIKNWFMLKSRISENVSWYDDKIMLVKAKNYAKIIESNNKKSVLDKAIEYCKIDVKCGIQIWKKFINDMKLAFGIDVPYTMVSLPQLSMQILKSKLPKGVELCIPDNDDYDFIRQAQFGGRVMAKKGVYGSCIYVDVVSEYPSVMWLYEHPYGESYTTDKINPERLGIYQVKLVFRPCKEHEYTESCVLCQKKRADYTEFLPRREEKRLKHSFLQELEGVWSTYDLEIALDDGYIVKEVIKGVEWPYKGKIFAPFIEAVKHIKENATSPSQRLGGKLIMNSVYGKMGQKIINKESKIVRRGVFQEVMLEHEDGGKIRIGDVEMDMPEFYDMDDDWEHMEINVDGVNRYPTQNSVFILSGARKFLRNHMLEIRKHAPNVRIVYSDTDSLIILEESLEGFDPSHMFGKKLGQLDDTVVKGYEGVRLENVVVCGKKMYGYEYIHPDSGAIASELHMKGVPNNLLTMEQLRFMLEDDELEKKVYYAMMIMKKNVVNIEMVDMEKKIGA